MFDTPPSEAQKRITTLPLPFDDDDLLHVSDLDEEEPYQYDLGIEAEPHEILDPDPTPIPNQRTKTKWAQMIISIAGDGVGNPKYLRRTTSQYQNEHVSLSHTSSLPTEWCNKFPQKCYLMIANDQPFGPQKNKIDHSIPPLEIRNT